MNMLKRFNQEEKVIKAKKQVYENVTFPRGFATFLEALVHENITKYDSHRQPTKEGYRWLDEVRLGGIILETTYYPYNTTKKAGNVTIIGSRDNLELVHSIMERHKAKFNDSIPPEDIELNIEYHNQLNPKLWTEQDGEYLLHDDVQEALEDASQAFFVFLELPDLEIEDVTMTGSSANYNWTESSDMDIHLVVDMTKATKEFGKLTVQYFDAIKQIWNELHDITIKGIPVEFYVQDTKETHNSTGVYSIKNEEWVIEPKHEEPDIDDNAVKLKAAQWMDSIKDVMTSNKADVIEKVMKKLSVLRQAGLDEAGEFSVENLAFKVLRNHGYLDMLADLKTKTFDRELSIQDEEWARLR